MPKKAKETPTFVYIKVTLKGIRPAIWRRLVLPVSLTLDQLSDAILRGMGWRGGHLHIFEIGGREYSDVSQFDEAEDERRMTIKTLMSSGFQRFSYTYDFGDDWEHDILIEKKAVPADEPAPGCVAGARACPPEDCGGWPGYEEFLAALAAPDEPENRELLEGMDAEDFDPEEFSVEEMDRGLKALASLRG